MNLHCISNIRNILPKLFIVQIRGISSAWLREIIALYIKILPPVPSSMVRHINTSKLHYLPSSHFYLTMRLDHRHFYFYGTRMLERNFRCLLYVCLFICCSLPDESHWEVHQKVSMQQLIYIFGKNQMPKVQSSFSCQWKRGQTLHLHASVVKSVKMALFTAENK